MTHKTIIPGATDVIGKAAARDIAQRFPRLDVLLHNAGFFMKQRELSEDGFEKTFAVNHLTSFALTIYLLPLLRTSHARLVTVSSVAHTAVALLCRHQWWNPNNF